MPNRVNPHDIPYLLSEDSLMKKALKIVTAIFAAECIVLDQSGKENVFPNEGGMLVVQPNAPDSLWQI
jgi:hypothetical protein